MQVCAFVRMRCECVYALGGKCYGEEESLKMVKLEVERPDAGRPGNNGRTGRRTFRLGEARTGGGSGLRARPLVTC